MRGVLTLVIELWSFDNPGRLLSPHFGSVRLILTLSQIGLRQYNFALNLTSIGGLHTKLWASKVTKVPILGFSGLPLGSPETKWHLGAGPMARHREYYKGKGGGFPQVWVVVNFVRSCLLMVRSCTKNVQLCINQLVVWFVQVHVSN